MTLNTPLIPDNAPFSPEQRSWLNGFLAGVLGRGQSTSPMAVAAVPSEPLLFLFGSQSGNAEGLAKKLAKKATSRGFASRAVGLDAISPNDLVKEKNVLIISSTWGEGEMPDNAAAFWSGLNQNGASPSLQGVRYSVLALGDMNYADTFCKAGRDLDARLLALGAECVTPRVECDVEFDDPAQTWSEAAFSALSGSPMALAAPSLVEETEDTGYSKKRPFPAALLENRMLNAPESAKDTRHIGLSLAGSGLVYETGDALGVCVQNCPGVVDHVIANHQLDPNFQVTIPNGKMVSLREALISTFEVRSLIGKTVSNVDPTAFVADLRKLQPRLYSISSSLKANPEQVHLTVGAVRYEKDGVQHKGVASTFLADRLDLGQTTGVFIHTAPHFRLPTDLSKDVIMVGPGTGIAPFRAFLQERKATAATGRNWLFFGDQHASTDFLYQTEMEAFLREGMLTKLDLAFSRDQAEKVYVQTKMLESGSELWSWLTAGAHFYVCGDASRMAKDVDAALHQIAQEHGALSETDAAAFIADLKKTKRYARDVY
jgi:sulfite reductase (NADPH) flavoprotein alpha-component